MKTSITLKNKKLCVSSAYNPVFVERFRQIEGRRFDGDTKEWTFNANKESLLAICDVAGLLPWMLSSEIQAILTEDGVKPPEAKPVDLGLINGHVFLTEPFEHQRVNLARLLGNDRWLLADDMGTGKSKAIADRLLIFHRTSYRDPKVLILCPKSVVQGWCEQLMVHAKLFGEIVQGNAKDRTDALASPSGIKIANYELLLHSDFTTIPWDVVILDEIHRVKNWTAQTSKQVRKLTAQAAYTWGLSGTPAPNGLEDWFGVLGAIDPDLLPVKTKTAFEARYCVKREIQPGIWKVSGYKNVQELHGFIQSVTSRVTKEQCLDLPPKVFSVRRAAMEGEQAKVYRDIKKDAVANIQRAKSEGTLTVKNVLQESLRLLQITGGFFSADDGEIHELKEKCKVNALADVLDEIGDKQVVVWCAFRPEVAWLAKWLEKNYGRVAVLTGGITGDERTTAIEDFKLGDARFFLGTAAAGGTGINGLSVSDTEIYYSRDFNFATYSQSVDRLHRIGQTRTVNVIKLLADNSIDGVCDRSLDNKGDMMQMMLNDPREMF